jgi:hypothetical protein
MLSESIGGAPFTCTLTPTAGRCAIRLVAASASSSGSSGRVSVSLRNWSKRSGIAMRAGGMRTLAAPAAGSISSSAPVISRPFRPSIWQGSGSTSRIGAG